MPKILLEQFQNVTKEVGVSVALPSDNYKAPHMDMMFALNSRTTPEVTIHSVRKKQNFL